MKTTKQLEAIYNTIKAKQKDKDGGGAYYSFETFKDTAKRFIKDIKTSKTVCSMKVSSSGITRHFNYKDYNMLLNMLYNDKMSHEAVKVCGCGMDMHFYLQYRACQKLCPAKEAEKLNYNCSFGYIL